MKTTYLKYGLLVLVFFSPGCFLLPLSELEYQQRKFTFELEDFEWNRPAVADDSGNIYFKGTSRNLYRWNINTGLKEIAHFDGTVWDVAVDNNAGVLLIAESENIWQYDLNTGNLSKVFTDPESLSIDNLCIVETHIVADAGTRPKNRLIRLSDFTVADTVEWGESSSYSVFAASLNRRFLTPSLTEMGYQVIDLVGENIGFYNDCVDDWEYYPLDPIKLYPDESQIIVSSGNIFNTDTDMTHSGFGHSYNDLVFYENKILLLTNDWDSTELIALSMDTYELLRSPLEFEDAEGRNLFVSDHYLYVVTDDWDYITYITRFDLDDF